MDCMNSNKGNRLINVFLHLLNFNYFNNFCMIGGKRPGNSQLPLDINPCFCKYGNNCTVASTGIVQVQIT